MTVYDQGFYDTIREGTQNSAQVVVPLICDAIGGVPKSMVDVGCGEGWWALEFAKLGSRVVGLDGAYVAGSPLVERFVAADLDRTLPLIGRFDLALSLEVAEHLSPMRSDSFVGDLCSLAPIVVFSAALPGQGGHGHVNERYMAEWAEMFDARGFAVSGALRWPIWDDDRIEPWYRMNLMVAVREPVHLTTPMPALFGRGVVSAPISVIHPITWGYHRGVRSS